MYIPVWLYYIFVTVFIICICYLSAYALICVFIMVKDFIIEIIERR